MKQVNAHTIHRALMALLLGGLMLANVACSTPAVPETTDTYKYDAAMNSYQNCVNRNYPTDRGYSCDSAASGNSQSRLQYLGTTAEAYYGPSLQYTPQQYYYSKTSSKDAPDVSADARALKDAENAAWVEYVKQLDEKTLNEMKAQWDAL
jgi:hypothetical protein